MAVVSAFILQADGNREGPSTRDLRAEVFTQPRAKLLYGDADPYAYVVSANAHRRHLTREQKRELIEKLLRAQPDKSDRQIAATVKASPTTVGTVRTELEQT